MEKDAKTVEMKAVPGGKPSESKDNRKLSYEELNSACAEMSQQIQQQNKYIQQMYAKMQQMEGALQMKRLDYLFEVVKLSMGEGKYGFKAEFVESCIAEIEESLTIPETTDSEEE